MMQSVANPFFLFFGVWTTAVALHVKYKAEVDRPDGTRGVDRLAQCRYLNMDPVVERALSVFRGIRDRA